MTKFVDVCDVTCFRDGCDGNNGASRLTWLQCPDILLVHFKWCVLSCCHFYPACGVKQCQFDLLLCMCSYCFIYDLTTGYLPIMCDLHNVLCTMWSGVTRKVKAILHLDQTVTLTNNTMTQVLLLFFIYGHSAHLTISHCQEFYIMTWRCLSNRELEILKSGMQKQCE